MSSQISSQMVTPGQNYAGVDQPSEPSSLVQWLARRRVAISLIGFSVLASCNILVLRTIPLNPLDIKNPLVVIALLLIAAGVGIRSWSAGTLNKMRELTQHGIYSVVRNPLYVGSFLMMLGFCVLCKDIPTMLFIAGPVALVYWAQVRFEEIRLAQKFPEWFSYAQRVPRFFPRSISKLAFRGWSLAEWIRNREYKALVASLLGVGAIVVWSTMFGM